MFTGLSINTRVTAPFAAIRTRDQLGGDGDVYNNCLAISGHLQQYGSPVRSLEYVTVAPASTLDHPTMIGLHQQTTDEIYFMVLGGEGLLTTNGQKDLVGPGDLVIAPTGTRHSLRNKMNTALGFLVVEVESANDEHHEPSIVRGLLKELQSGATISLDLKGYFSEYWGALSLTNLPGSGRILSHCEADYDQILFVVAGNATLLIEDQDGKEVFREMTDGFGLSAFIPKGVRRTLINRSSLDPLLMLTLNILPGGAIHA